MTRPMSKKRIEAANRAVAQSPEFRLGLALGTLGFLDQATDEVNPDDPWIVRASLEGSLSYFRQVRDEAIMAIEREAEV